MPFQLPLASLHDEITQITATEDSARNFLIGKQVLRRMVTCSSCSSQVVLIQCAASKSADGYIWKCQTCKKFTNILNGSVLCGKKLSFKSFLTMIFYFSIRSLTNTEKRRCLPWLVCPQRLLVSGGRS